MSDLRIELTSAEASAWFRAVAEALLIVQGGLTREGRIYLENNAPVAGVHPLDFDPLLQQVVASPAVQAAMISAQTRAAVETAGLGRSVSLELSLKASEACASVKDSVGRAVDEGKSIIDNQKAFVAEAIEAGKRAFEDRRKDLSGKGHSRE